MSVLLEGPLNIIKKESKLYLQFFYSNKHLRIFIKADDCKDWPGQFYTQIPIEDDGSKFSLCLQHYYQYDGTLYCLLGQAKGVKMSKVKNAEQLRDESSKKFWWSYTGFFLINGIFGRRSFDLSKN